MECQECKFYKPMYYDEGRCRKHRCATFPDAECIDRLKRIENIKAIVGFVLICALICFAGAIEKGTIPATWQMVLFTCLGASIMIFLLCKFANWKG